MKSRSGDHPLRLSFSSPTGIKASSQIRALNMAKSYDKIHFKTSETKMIEEVS